MVRHFLIYKAFPHMFSSSHHTYLVRSVDKSIEAETQRSSDFQVPTPWKYQSFYSLYGFLAPGDTFFSTTRHMSPIAPICHLSGGRNSRDQLKNSN